MKTRLTLEEVILAIAIALLLVVFAWSLAAKAEPPMVEIMVPPGGTLWDLSRDYCPPEADRRRWIYEVRETNGITDPGKIQPGQVIRVADWRQLK